MKAHRVSIGLPVFNGGPFLRDSLDSLLAQDFADFELIISDNASTDDTEAVCRDALRRDRRVRYHRNARNIGAARNYNQVFALARGEYFRWAAADDLCHPSHLRRCVERLDAAPPDTVLAYPRTVLIDARGGRAARYEDRLDLQDRRPHRRLQQLLRELHLCNPVFGLMRREVLAKTALIGSYVAADEVLLAELALRGRIAEIPEDLFLRRIHAGGSQFANATPETKAAWFDPNNGGKPICPRTRLYLEHCAAIRRAPLARLERLRCHLVLNRTWLPRHWRVIGGEMRRRLHSAIRPARRAG